MASIRTQKTDSKKPISRKGMQGKFLRGALFCLGALVPTLFHAGCDGGGEDLNTTEGSFTKYLAPAWAKRVVWYQIFPERFRNGDPSNDPTVGDIRGAWPHDHTAPWEVHPWTSDWYDLKPYEKRNGRDIWFNIQRRRYGGDLQGIIDKLDYLSDLGIGALYLNPVFAAPSHHKYDASTYHHIDPNFGPDPTGDRRLMASEVPHDPATWVWTTADRLMRELIKEVHARGMRIIFDGVFNHMGITSWAFQDVVKHQQESGFRDWFEITSWDDPAMGSSFDYNGWFGVRELPELKEDENGIVSGPRGYIFDITRRWMDPDGDGDPSDGIDGWRLDVAFCVKHPFWKAWREVVKGINPEAYLTAEIVDPIPAIKPYLRGDEFDAVMNYNFAFACAEYFIQREKRINTTEFDRLLRELREAFHPEMAFVMQNLLGSHDSNRIASHIVNRVWADYRNWSSYFGQSKGENHAYDTRKPNDDEIRIQKLLAIFQMTYLGAPMIYYGDEVGMWGANDPCSRKPMVWEDLSYDPERTLPSGLPRAEPDEVVVNRGLLSHYRQLIAIRNSCDALQIGDFETLVVDNERSLYAYCRSVPGNTAVVAVNNGSNKECCELFVHDISRMRDVLNGRVYQVEQGVLKLFVPSFWGAILINDSDGEPAS